MTARLTKGTATLKEGQEVVDRAIRLAGNCAATYLRSKPARRGLFNAVMFKEVRVRNGKIEGVEYQDPFGLIFVEPKKFEYGGMERETSFEPVAAMIKTSGLYSASAHRRAWKRTDLRSCRGQVSMSNASRQVSVFGSHRSRPDIVSTISVATISR